MSKNSDKHVYSENCTECIFAIKSGNKIKCGDRGWFLRALMGLRQMPRDAKCNYFVPLWARQCQFCEFCDMKQDSVGKCFNADFMTLILDGPKTVCPTDKCVYFSFDKKYKGRVR